MITSTQLNLRLAENSKVIEEYGEIVFISLTFIVDLTTNLMGELHYECERRKHNFPCSKITKDLLMTHIIDAATQACTWEGNIRNWCACCWYWWKLTFLHIWEDSSPNYAIGFEWTSMEKKVVFLLFLNMSWHSQFEFDLDNKISILFSL